MKRKRPASHYARIEKSPRLLRVLALLMKGGWCSTMQIIKRARVCAVSTCIHELRQNKFNIICTQKKPYANAEGEAWYRMVRK